MLCIDKEIIDWLFNTFGGHIYIKSENRKPHYHQKWCWYLTKAEDVVPFLKKAIPYLKLKKNRAILTLEYKKKALKTRGQFIKKISPKEKIRREEIFKQIKYENQRMGMRNIQWQV